MSWRKGRGAGRALSSAGLQNICRAKKFWFLPKIPESSRELELGRCCLPLGASQGKFSCGKLPQDRIFYYYYFSQGDEAALVALIAASPNSSQLPGNGKGTGGRRGQHRPGWSPCHGSGLIPRWITPPWDLEFDFTPGLCRPRVPVGIADSSQGSQQFSIHISEMFSPTPGHSQSLGRFLWVQHIPESDTAMGRGLGCGDEPWCCWRRHS